MLNKFPSFFVKQRRCRWLCCILFLGPVYYGCAWVWLVFFFFLCVWIVWVPCRCILSVTDAILSICNPSLVWSRCILCRPTMSWLCNFLRVFFWGGGHVSIPRISRGNCLPPVWIVLVASRVSRVRVLVFLLLAAFIKSLFKDLVG